MVIEKFGFDFFKGRQDKTHHPFETRFSSGDVRIATRIQENDFGTASSPPPTNPVMHCTNQGVDRVLEGTPLAQGQVLALHEFQSRRVENIVSRSRPFLGVLLPGLQKTFPDQLGSVSLDTFYRA